jgi:hypothetical protein
MSKGRACMYTCRFTAGCIHLYNFSKMKTNNATNQAGSTGIEHQNPLKTHKLTLIKKMKG